MEKCLFWDECPLHNGINNPFIPLTGSAKPEVIIVGEAPGYNEDVQGENFVGESGKLIRKLLKTAGFDFSTIAFTNTVKCRPITETKQNRTPTAKEAKRCYIHAKAEIDATKPKLVILLGSVAFSTFLGKTNLTLNRGRVINYEGTLYLPTLHPAAILRNPQLKELLLHDLEYAYSILINGYKEEKEHYNLVFCDTIEKLDTCVNDILSSSEFAFDTETSALSPYFDGSLVCVSLSCSMDTAYVIPITNKYGQIFERLKMLKQYLKAIFENDIPKIAHNAKFDISWLRQFGIEVKNLKYDTMLMSYLLEEKQNGLDYLVLNYTSLGAYWEELEVYTKEHKEANPNRGSYANIPWDVLFPYSALDALATYQVKQILWSKLNEV